MLSSANVEMTPPIDSLFAALGLTPAAHDWLRLTDVLGRARTTDTPFPSSFAVGEMVQATIAAAALAANELGAARNGLRHRIEVDRSAAEHECTGWFSIDGITPQAWDAFAGLYRTRDGWVRIHTNFIHHRDGALALLGLDAATATRNDVAQQLLRWSALEFETAAAQAQLVATALRTFEQWDASPQGRAVAEQPLFSMHAIGAAPVMGIARAAASLPTSRPLAGIRVLDLTRILAGPTCGRVLATYGADVMLVNAPHLPNIDHIADTSRGKRSVLIDLKTAEGRSTFTHLLRDAHVVVEGYRPGGLAALGFGPQALAALRPGIVVVSLSAYGRRGPWGERRGFDSLTQTAMGFNAAEGEAFTRSDATPPSAQPRALPYQALDYATGFLMAACTSVALLRQQQSGQSWLVQCGLAQTAQWLRTWPRQIVRTQSDALQVKLERERFVETLQSGFGQLQSIRHAASFGGEVWSPSLPSVPPGSSAPQW